MLQINVADLLASYPGDSKLLEFDGEILPGYYEDIVFTKPLSFRIKLIALDDGVEVVFESLDTQIIHEETTHTIHLEDIARTFKQTYEPLLSDDIKFINPQGMTVDLHDVIREEMLISVY